MSQAAADTLVAEADEAFRAEKFEEAAAKFERASQVFPLHPLAWRGLGHSLLCMGRPQEAARAFDRAVGLVPQLDPRELERSLGLLGRIPDSTILRLFDLLSGLPDQDVIDLVEALSRLSPAAARRATKLMSGVIRTVAR